MTARWTRVGCLPQDTVVPPVVSHPMAWTTMLNSLWEVLPPGSGAFCRGTDSPDFLKGMAYTRILTSVFEPEPMVLSICALVRGLRTTTPPREGPIPTAMAEWSYEMAGSFGAGAGRALPIATDCAGMRFRSCLRFAVWLTLHGDQRVLSLSLRRQAVLRHC